MLRVLGPRGVLDLQTSQLTQNGAGTISAVMITSAIDWYTGIRRAWNVMGPHDGTSLTLPRLPIESVDLSLTDADGVTFGYVEIGNIPSGHQAATLTPYWSLTVLAPPVTGPSSGILETSAWFAP